MKLSDEKVSFLLFVLNTSLDYLVSVNVASYLDYLYFLVTL